MERVGGAEGQTHGREEGDTRPVVAVDREGRDERVTGPGADAGMISRFEGSPAGGGGSEAVRNDLARHFGWLVAPFNDPSDLDALAARLLHVALPAHTPLLPCGAPSSALYLVARGALSVTVASIGRRETEHDGVAAGTPTARVVERAQGTPHCLAESNAGGTLTLGHIQAGGWIGENALVNPEPPGYGVTVARDTRLLVLTNSQFAKLRQERLSAASTLLQAFSLQVADRFRAYRRQVAAQSLAGGRPRTEPGRSSKNVTLLAALLGI